MTALWTIYRIWQSLLSSKTIPYSSVTWSSFRKELAIDRFKCASSLCFTLIIFKQVNFCRFTASAYTNVDRLCAVFLCNYRCIHYCVSCINVRYLGQLLVPFFEPCCPAHGVLCAMLSFFLCWVEQIKIDWLIDNTLVCHVVADH